VSGILEHHGLNTLHGRYGTLVLQGDESVTPLSRKEVVHATKMLSQLDEYGAILLQYDQGTLGAVLVAGLEKSLVVLFGQSIVLFEGAAVVVDVEGESADDSSSTLGSEPDVAGVVADRDSACSGEDYATHDIQAAAGLG
jgi:hypothetical protein